MLLFCAIFYTVMSANFVSCSIAGISYQDEMKRKQKYHRGEDPCKSLFWFPRNIPEHCDSKIQTEQVPSPPEDPLLVPIPIPMPMKPMPYPSPMPVPVPMPLPGPMPMPGPLLPIPAPVPLTQLPYGIPIEMADNMFPVLADSIPSYRNPIAYEKPIPKPMPMPYLPPFYGHAGFVPNMPGIMSPDGGINVLPFSDVYTELLEKHEQKKIRKEMERLIKKYKSKINRRYSKEEKDKELIEEDYEEDNYYKRFLQYN